MLQLLFGLLLAQPQVWSDEVAHFPKTGWLALTDTALVPVKLRFIPDPREPRMLSVDTGDVDPTLLVHGVPGLEPRAIANATFETLGDLHRGGSPVSMQLGQRRYMVSFDGPDVRLADADGHRQVLWTQHIDDVFYVVTWAGDLDRDGKLDLLVNFNESSMSHSVLFLSSRAKPGQLVGEAARFEHAAC